MDNKQMDRKYEQDYETWDAFLREWPIERLRSMTIDEYSKAGSKDTFTYWLEARLEKLGSIWGGSAFKFGIYSRKNMADKQPGEGLLYSPTFAWYARYGQSPEEAFDRVKSIVVSIAEAAQSGNLEAIDSVEFGEAVKWKIAFHYQNRDTPVVVNAFKRVALCAFLEITDTGRAFSWLYREALSKKREDEGILEFGSRLWRSWAVKDINIWKMSHGPGSFSAAELMSMADNHLALLHRSTGKDQAKQFGKAPTGSLFYLCHGNNMQLLARFTSAVEASPDRGDEWLQRKYQVIKTAITNTPFEASSKNWTPRGNSTFWQVPKGDLLEFEDVLLRPYFGLSLDAIAALEPIPDSEAAPNDVASIVSRTDETSAPAGPLNRILFGPPGTGKTYRSVAEAVSIIEGEPLDGLMSPEEYSATKRRFDTYRAGGQVEFVTFHPSYAYQDFVEGIRPQPTADGGLNYDVDPGVFRRIAEKARANWEASRVEFDAAVADEERFDRAYRQLLTDIEESEQGYVNASLYRGSESHIKVGPKERSLTILLPGYSTVYNLPKHQLKSLWARRPEVKTPGDTELYNASFFWAVLKLLERIDLRLGAPVVSGKEPPKRFVLVVDEINRGNIAKIFGELITLIEDDKRLGAPNELTVRLPYSPDERPFGLPPNLYLVGTMNTADRSIALIDTALRRRFHFVELMPDVSVLRDIPDADVSTSKLLSVINARIEYLFDREHTVGHAYLSGVESFEQLVERLKGKIVPLLQEYFHDDWSKIRMVMNDGPAKPRELHIIREDVVDPMTMGAAFLDAEPRSRYSVVEAFTVEMIRAIYE
ncbi:AAA domain-containing protein [Paraburkholderia sp. JPY303]|uniref:McrB family protein n=1 Tax=Paraburkholderia atlantica TaxID=2654982 RepID=UPI0020CADE3E|nr:AAA family ATPase [Paraburkholderia atlantica]NUY33823.1 AAA domain-containing protein [Paraburkholderia atlantica]